MFSVVLILNNFFTYAEYCILKEVYVNIDSVQHVYENWDALNFLLIGDE